jgi:hypothetical protein
MADNAFPEVPAPPMEEGYTLSEEGNMEFESFLLQLQGEVCVARVYPGQVCVGCPDHESTPISPCRKSFQT